MFYIHWRPPHTNWTYLFLPLGWTCHKNSTTTKRTTTKNTTYKNLGKFNSKIPISFQQVPPRFPHVHWNPYRLKARNPTIPCCCPISSHRTFDWMDPNPRFGAKTDQTRWVWLQVRHVVILLYSTFLTYSSSQNCPSYFHKNFIELIVCKSTCSTSLSPDLLRPSKRSVYVVYLSTSGGWQLTSMLLVCHNYRV